MPGHLLAFSTLRRAGGTINAKTVDFWEQWVLQEGRGDETSICTCLEGGGWVNIYTNDTIGIDNYGTIVITSRQIRYTGNHNSGLLTLTKAKADYEEKATEQDSKMCFNQRTKRNVLQKYVWLTTEDILC
jgi:hypothetical protein